MQDIVNGRCGWCGTDELYVKYHDQEWGNLVTDDKTLFEFLVLESAQAGLSWITILKNCLIAFRHLLLVLIDPFSPDVRVLRRVTCLAAASA